MIVSPKQRMSEFHEAVFGFALIWKRWIHPKYGRLLSQDFISQNRVVKSSRMTQLHFKGQEKALLSAE